MAIGNGWKEYGEDGMKLNNKITKTSFTFNSALVKYLVVGTKKRQNKKYIGGSLDIKE